MSKKNTGPVKANREQKREEGHAKWALEIQTEGLDPEQAPPIDVDKAAPADKKSDEQSKGSNCGCKYF